MTEASPVAPRKVMGRILSLGVPLPGPQVDNYTFLSAPSFFDYDAIVVDPHALSRLIEGVVDGSIASTTFADVPITNGPATPASASLAEALLRRADETRTLLERDGAVICFAHAATTHADVVGAGA